MKTPRLMAVDPSLTCSGWALSQLQPERLTAVGSIKSLPPIHTMADRLTDIQSKITKVLSNLKLSSSDWLICEAPTTMRDPRAAFLVEQVRCIFEVLARMRGVRVPGRLNPRTVHREILGMAGQQLPRVEVKSAAAVVAKQIYGPALNRLGFDLSARSMKRHQDIIDAILLGNLALSKVRSAEWGKIPLEELLDRRMIRRVATAS